MGEGAGPDHTQPHLWARKRNLAPFPADQEACRACQQRCRDLPGLWVGITGASNATWRGVFGVEGNLEPYR